MCVSIYYSRYCLLSSEMLYLPCTRVNVSTADAIMHYRVNLIQKKLKLDEINFIGHCHINGVGTLTQSTMSKGN